MHIANEEHGPRIGLNAWQHCALFLLACAILVTQRPEAIFQAQFYAEDGPAWFADAYNSGWWHALFLPTVRVFQTVPLS